MAAKILLVEDNEMNRDMLSRRLQRRGYEVLTAVDGESGLTLTRSEAPALILMDMSLPGIDGWEATRQLKADPATRAIPVIALTAHAMAGDREQALAAGCDDFDIKPIDLDRLLGKIEALLGGNEDMSTRRKPPGPPRTKAEALARVARLERQVRSLQRQLERSTRRADEALEQQTATADVLRIISTSPTELQPVLDTVVRSATRFCGAHDANIHHLDDGRIRVGAHHGPVPTLLSLNAPLTRGTVVGRAILDRQAIHVADLQAEEQEFPEGCAYAKELGYHTTLSVPLLREGVAVGAIQLRRTEVNPFTDAQIALLRTFADQAVIAIENVRLFKELEARNAELTESLEQQTATAEILRAISESTTDVQPVFEAIAENAVRLSGALFGSVYRFDGELIHMVAHHNYPPAALEFSRRSFPTRPSRQTFTGAGDPRARRRSCAGRVAGPGASAARDLAEVVGFRSALSVPMLREGSPIGAITVCRSAVGPFSDKHIALLQTFADQAVIAIENVRLFKELEARNRDAQARRWSSRRRPRDPAGHQPDRTTRSAAGVRDASPTARSGCASACAALVLPVRRRAACDVGRRRRPPRERWTHAGARTLAPWGARAPPAGLSSSVAIVIADTHDVDVAESPQYADARRRRRG